jgi:hypothetical protein
LAAALLKESLALELVGSGLGFLPFPSNEHDKILNLFTVFDHVDVRDELSSNCLSQVCEELSFSGDDLLLALHEGASPPVQNLPAPALIICLQNDLFPGDEGIRSLITGNFLQLIRSKGIREIVLAGAMREDVKALPADISELSKSLGFIVKEYSFEQVLQKGFPLHPQGFVVTSRYHPHFLAALTGVKGVAISSIPYYEVKHQAVKKMGSKWQTIHSGFSEADLFPILKAALESENKTFDGDILRVFLGKKLHIAETMIAPLGKKYRRAFDLFPMLKGVVQGSLERDSTIKMLRSLVSDYERTIRDHQSVLALIYQSKSWRSTLPLRVLANILRAGIKIFRR